MLTITRKSLLNRSALGFFAINHVQGCSHGCRYPCYAFTMARAHGRARDYADWTAPRLVANARELLEGELARRRELPERVHLSLTTDPFMYGHPEIEALSLDLAALLNGRGVPVSILTKGILPRSLADRNRFPCDNSYGISLVSLDEGFRERWEPGAAPFAARLAALRELSRAGRSTYVHVEPYPTPNILEQDLEAFLEALSFADRIYFGGWNYNALASRFPDREGFYRAAADRVRSFCLREGITFEGG